MISIGIDIGYSSIKFAIIDEKDRLIYDKYVPHKGHIRSVFIENIEKIINQYKSENIFYGAFIGSNRSFVIDSDKIEKVNETSAIVEGSIHVNDQVGSIIEIGGQSAKYITNFNADDKSRIKISMNSSCSAGTGSFLEAQMSRLKLKMEDFAAIAEKGTFVPRIAGRCSVFAKTDITHHQQKGVSVSDILLGLAHSMVRNYRASVMGRLPRKRPILFVGGVAHNRAIVRAMRERLDLQEGELIVPEHFSTIGALGAAIIARREKIPMSLEDVLTLAKRGAAFFEETDATLPLPALSSFGDGDSAGKHRFAVPKKDPVDIPCYLGIDIGSTSTNLVLMDENDQILWFSYLRTMGDPVGAVKKGFQEIRDGLADRLRIKGVGTTGSGRHMIGKLIGADVIRDEITSQAKAAVTLDADVDTVFEIGGQDSKYIRLEKGVVTDFQMNKICAAGTGSFIEEQANKFNIPIEEFGSMALSSNRPINLGERCTVFMETSIASQLSKGSELNDIASGLCYSIVKNYINRVVGHKKIGDKLFFQGGVAYNQGVVNAFRALTGKEIVVPSFFSVTGAYGVALLAREEMAGRRSGFKGFEVEEVKGPLETPTVPDSPIDSAELFNRENELLIFYGDDKTIEKTRKTIGIPRALFTYGMYPMFSRIFKELGFNVLLSDPTSEETIRLGQEYSLGEACYPVKLINGHVAELVRKKVDYIFFPDLYTVDHPGSHTRKNFGCPYMQLAFKVINQAMDLGSRGIGLLAPTIGFSLGKEFMMKSFTDLGDQLGVGPEEIRHALEQGMKEYHFFEKSMLKFGKESIKRIKPDEKAFVIVSKIYGVVDPVLNMGIPGKLMDMGYKVMGFYGLPEGDIAEEHPNMYWPFGQHILEAGQVIKAHPNLYAILLTHHGCGPDSVLSHYFKEIMDGKPYLNIEVDEHSSDVGVLTRLEAFVGSLSKIEPYKADKIEAYIKNITHKKVNIYTDLEDIDWNKTFYLPYLYPYSHIFEKMLLRRGVRARVLPGTNQASLAMGRMHTLTNEYLSLTALLGDVLQVLNGGPSSRDGISVLIPQTEGAEIDGQANRFVRAKLDECGYANVDVISPFMEDVSGYPEPVVRSIFLGLLAGDLVRLAPPGERDRTLGEIYNITQKKGLWITDLMEMAKKIRYEWQNMNDEKTILAIGEPYIVYNDFLNNDCFKDIEKRGYRVVYSPFSEHVWMMWKDFIDQNANLNIDHFDQYLNEYKNWMIMLSVSLGDCNFFTNDIDALVEMANKTIGYYAGAFGRYREAKVLSGLNGIDGVIAASSMYENTSISLDILHKEFENEKTRPLLSLTFDGNESENDRAKVDSYLYYL